MSGWTLACPVCWRQMLPVDGLLSDLVPRLAYHLWDEHPVEAAFLRLHLTNPPVDWPVVEAAA
jgi:hypothetical protein